MASEEEGVQAIKELQAMAGIEESDKSAQQTWANFSAQEKQTTMKVHRACFPEKYEVK